MVMIQHIVYKIKCTYSSYVPLLHEQPLILFPFLLVKKALFFLQFACVLEQRFLQHYSFLLYQTGCPRKNINIGNQ